VVCAINSLADAPLEDGLVLLPVASAAGSEVPMGLALHSADGAWFSVFGAPNGSLAWLIQSFTR